MIFTFGVTFSVLAYLAFLRDLAVGFVIVIGNGNRQSPMDSVTLLIHQEIN